jgi:cell division protein FtsI/penicillin-binding protein 2
VDPALQRAASRILDASRAPGGAVVVSDVRTGRILAWASRGEIDYVRTPIAPSASLFKVVTAAALLESHRVGLATRQCYAGGERAITEDDLDDDPRTDVACPAFADALGRSINVVVARLALKHLTPEKLEAQAEAFGFDRPLPIDVATEPSVVTIPSERLAVARAAAGGWNGRLSPQGARFVMQTIANGGERIRMTLFDRGEPPVRVSAGRAISAETADALRHMLEGTTRSGTCAKAFHNPDGTRALGGMPVAGKTGTLIGGHPTRMFSWFAGFAPANAPEIAIAVLLADDVSWWMKANVAARKVLEAYFASRPPTSP